MKNGLPEHLVVNIVERQLEIAREVPEHMAALVKYLNKLREEQQNEAAGKISQDKVINNLSKLLERKQMRLESLSPEIVQNIIRFDHLNNFEKTDQ